MAVDIRSEKKIEFASLPGGQAAERLDNGKELGLSRATV